jgi:hypothetical protein
MKSVADRLRVVLSVAWSGPCSTPSTAEKMKLVAAASAVAAAIPTNPRVQVRPGI